MPDITVRSGQRVNPILTNVARQTRPQGYVADLIAPRIQVPKEQVKYAVWGA